MRVAYQEIIQNLEKILLKNGFTEDRAKLCSILFTQASLDGVASHGLDRFPVFLEMIRKKLVLPNQEASILDSYGVFERWNGNLGPGPLNAYQCMDRAIQISKELGVGIVALQNTNHWMRAGNYGWQAAEAGCIGICFTNTKPNMPAWGGSEPKLGNNPLVIAIPHSDGHIVLDMAMSQFSYGKLKTYLREGKEMPFDAGFDADGNLTKSPESVIANELALPVGLWKGAGLSLLLDMLATILSGGKSTFQVGESGEEFSLSQVFICLDAEKIGIKEWSEEKLDAIISDLQSSSTFVGSEIRYPGGKIPEIRKQNMEHGIPVDEKIWKSIIKEL
ncbi:3-dehydro-L-gulonate 2-dehydrogenase [Aquiflexum sp. TKW24L]|uniref:3-dehydro-L-gulonate 2-dehydrogenase n=1 Tax=Aquiflexum sp. TKW24L TaxID=2942212 RepID=UPI0020BD816A|nr:3-dehydro-L-gulonate 2-dehydrogenase [Aquiflexum sp. TKW24L]MCL6258797.1 3-dehydro-L-gulonate 2-dehydrogenase [Aquiflexum sp. TKW24L]